ncbi:MAG TPA: carbon-nitrogen hydrolase family protein [Gammaproteobacteria bacterium]|nr:carbon-nitrogen hydrolase family protein [Gammaproteobacteria bacterium]
MSVVACIQMASGPNIGANLLEAERLIHEAVSQKARLVVLPENFALMGNTEHDKVAAREKEGSGAIQTFLSEQSACHGIWLVGGTIPLVANDANKVRAACLVFDDKGRQVARYDKIHLFDVELVDSGEQYTESDTIEPGNNVVVIDTPFGRMGVAVCYDLRFPELFRQQLEAGMEILVLPSAFTAITGRAHWDVLVRARAIENQCYVVAPDQGGFHLNGRETYGHSMIVDPWGTVLNSLSRGPGVVCADVELGRLQNARRNFPSISHRRLQCLNK